LPTLFSIKPILTKMELLIKVNSITSSDKVVLLVHGNHHHHHSVLVLVGVLALDGVLVHQALNTELLVLVSVVLMVHHTVLVAVLLVAVLLMLVMLLVELPMMLQLLQLAKSTMLLMLKDSSKIQTHKSSAVPTQLVYKHIPKTSVFASFNHHQYQLQAHSSSKKCAHLNHQYHPHFVFVK